MHRRDTLRLLTLSALVAAGTGGVGAVALARSAGGRDSDAPSPAPPSADIGQVASAITAFGADLAGQFDGKGGNWVASPLSIAYAFGMLRAGAGGTTAAEIDRVFRFPAGIHPALNGISRAVGTGDAPTASPAGGGDQPQPAVVRLSNGLFVQDKTSVGRTFQSTLKAHYGAALKMIDFSRPGAVEAINSWVRRQTADQIRELFESLNPGTRVVLANAAYLKAQWASPFETRDTVRSSFKRATGGSVNVPMMHTVAPLRYAGGEGWQAVELPYAGGDLAMRVVVPTSNVSPYRLLARATLAAVDARLAPANVDLALPRWNATGRIDLAEALTALGVRSAFAPGADLSAIHPGLHVGQAVHQTRISVDEVGTEAAAATGIAMVTAVRMEETVVVRVDRSFAFAIMHTGTGVPLFTGVVADPAHRA